MFVGGVSQAQWGQVRALPGQGECSSRTQTGGSGGLSLWDLGGCCPKLRFNTADKKRKHRQHHPSLPTHTQPLDAEPLNWAARDTPSICHGGEKATGWVPVTQHRSATANGKAHRDRVQLDTDRERQNRGKTHWGGCGGTDGHTASKAEGEIP